MQIEQPNWTDEDSIEELRLICEQASDSLSSIRDFIRFCVTQLRQHDVVVAQGTEDTFAEAAAIVLHPLDLAWSADEQILDCQLTPLERQSILTLLQERIITRQPLSYLINLAYFCNLPFYVDERVLIPRSPIAELIEVGFYPTFGQEQQPVTSPHHLPAKFWESPSEILDLCTGSGCIAIAMAHRFPEAHVIATDIDKQALAVAAVNVDHHDKAHQVDLLASDLFESIAPATTFDLIVTNPPYVDAAEMAELPPEFLYEPDHALAAGQDGLDLVHQILYAAPDYLNEQGLLVCEVGSSAWHLGQAYPDIQFRWLSFAKGGDGIFAMTREELLANQSQFAQYVGSSTTRH